jgi:hypothetical protein
MSRIIKLVKHYRKSKDTVDIFGVILYTDEHPNVKKALNDEDYWKALDEISGKKWSIFSSSQKKGEMGYPDFPPNTIGYMRLIWKEPKKNKVLLEEFELENTQALPLFIAFTESGNRILKTQIEINDNSKDEAYNSIKDIISDITHAVENINPEDIKNSDEIYSTVSRILRNKIRWETLKKRFELLRWIKTLGYW